MTYRLDQIVVNAKTFNAKGDGSTDDTTAIQNAHAAAIADGIALFFPAGTYKITTTITFTVPVQFEVGAIISPLGCSAVISGGIITAHPR